MAVIHDMIPAFELFQPASLDDAIGLLDKYGNDAMVLAGGLDSMDWLKDRIRRPRYVVDLGAIEGLRGIKAAGDGVEIGAMTTLTEVVRSPLLKEKFGLLMEGAEKAASPQIRNQGTIGGNVSQDARCWYYRAGWPCYRAGGSTCYADTPTAINREHAIFGADRCVAVNPSDTAPAMIALDAKMVIRSSKGERIVDAQLFGECRRLHHDGVDGERGTVDPFERPRSHDDVDRVLRLADVPHDLLEPDMREWTRDVGVHLDRLRHPLSVALRRPLRQE